MRPWTASRRPAARPARRASMGPRPCGRGRRRGRGHHRPNEQASMGPRPCGRGRLSGRQACEIVRQASMGPRPCGRGRRVRRRHARPRRWASMGPRPCGRGRLDLALVYEPAAVGLQWGHGLAAVDGDPPGRRHARRGRASMGPRPCGRGRTRPQAGHGRAARFNGATALRPWTARAAGAHKGAYCASMGPRPCGRGRTGAARWFWRGIQKLQWGHGLAAVDGVGGGLTAMPPLTLQWGHGLAAVDGSSLPRIPRR